MRVLMVDDDAQVRQVVRRTLERADFAVTEAGDPEGALRAMNEWPIDVAVLDLNLPVMSGLELMSRLRQHDPDLPVIMLTGAGSEADRVRGLVSGADDYVVKPFSAQELAARVLAASRRRRSASVPVVEAGGIRINVTAREVSAGGDLVDLTRREFDLLLHLVQHPGRVFSRAELLHAVWASSAEWQSEATVTEHVRRLRSKLEPDPAKPVRIVTVRGLGYRFDLHLPATVDSAVTAAPEVSEPASPGGDLADDPTVVIQREIIVHANAATLALVGTHNIDLVVGRPFLDFMAPQSVGASMARHLDARSGHWPRPEMLTIRRLDGVEVNVEVASMPVVWEGEAASQITLWDLSEDTVRLRELATGFTSEVAESVIVTDAQSVIRSFNKAAELLYGWTEAEVVGREIGDVIPLVNDDEVGVAIRAAFHAEGRWHGEAKLPRRDGSAVDVRASITVLRGGNDQPVGMIFVTRRLDTRSPSPAGGGRPSYEDQALADEIHRGIQRGEFTLRYQPVIDLHTEEWRGVEALVRWEHPDRGLLAPAEFIDVAERSGAIVELGQSVFNEAARQWRKWRNQGLDLHIAVNLSGRQLADHELTTRIGSAMAIWSLPPGALRFEVTETALVEDLAQATAALGRLVDLGAQIAIDDFGTGWASLTYLREFPVHALKIDRVFVNGLGVHAPDTAIVASIISLGAELGLDVIAEGIETTTQRDRLLDLGCGMGQGYLFARPMTADAVVEQHR